MSSPSSLQLTYRADLDVLTARWFVPSAFPQLQQEYAAVLAAGLAHGTSRWLLDVRRTPTPSAEATHWVTAVWLPRAAGQVARPLHLAYLLSPQRTAAIFTDAGAHAQVEQVLAPGQSFQLQLFGDEGAAVRWLTEAPA
ncbi:hypothetical protein [Hymenobacter terricola]|uniref:hypothetical protein n=1 Tax=Hymenobacter terricola TaxID=2819236 RepID=UPI001B317133|nr:hypothetical protein [Hymenobacter terricola]